MSLISLVSFLRFSGTLDSGSVLGWETIVSLLAGAAADVLAVEAS
jgi:hypothetical protein